MRVFAFITLYIICSVSKVTVFSDNRKTNWGKSTKTPSLINKSKNLLGDKDAPLRVLIHI